MTDRVWHCPNGEPVEMTPEEVEALDFINFVLDTYDFDKGDE